MVKKRSFIMVKKRSFIMVKKDLLLWLKKTLGLPFRSYYDNHRSGIINELYVKLIGNCHFKRYSGKLIQAIHLLRVGYSV